MTEHIFLSYVLSDKISGYGNGKRVELIRTNSINKGDSSNNTELILPAHFGTHMDFPFHFDNDGKFGEEYPASFFIFNNVQIIEIDVSKDEGTLIGIDDLIKHDFSSDTELLLIKSGFGNFRSDDAYWNTGPGYKPEVAKYLKEKMPNLRVLGFDFISITSYQHRQLGKEAHKAFLKDEKLLVIEDMDLNLVNKQSKFKQITVSPLRYETCDGCPVTVIAEIKL